MFITHLQLADFRSYESVDIALEPGVTVFVGANGQGKTNLLEALEYLATLGSHRVASDAPLIRKDSERAMLRARIQAGLTDPRQLIAEIEINSNKANKAAINRSPLRRPRDILGSLRVVLFAPEDLTIVKGDPADRRHFIDDLNIARWPRLAGVRADYERVLKQRSALLKTAAGYRGISSEAEATLQVWDDSLANHGAELVLARLATLQELNPLIGQSYSHIAAEDDAAGASYRSSVSAFLPEADGFDWGTIPEIIVALKAQMQARRPEELARGVSLVGPHRDEIDFTLGGFPVKGYASHGESWSFACALRLASFGLLRTDGLEPVLMLDDVFAELDQSRRAKLAATALTAEQVLITAAVDQDIPVELVGARFRVLDGQVVSEPSKELADD